jgi:UDP-N-acetylmuramoyl-L-alanyl-D-glutamate--2,6-diaminopimelate ligase
VSQALGVLLEGTGARFPRGGEDQPVEAITADSRRVAPGSVFVAIRGTGSDGHQFLTAAAEAGAVAVVGEDAPALDACPVNVVAVVPDARAALGHALGVWYGRPDRRIEVLAVTGTNGKTTVAHLLRDLWNSRGRACGLLGTIAWDTIDESRPARLTTPGVEELDALIDRMAGAGARALAMEASSHALDQQRLGELEVDLALFTNLTRDHLDYHATLEEYLAAKLRLRGYLAQADRVKAAGRCVVNRDDARFARVEWPAGTVFVGHGEGCDVRGLGADFDRDGTTIDMDFGGTPVAVRSRLLGRYNAWNLLVVAGAALASGMTAREFADHAGALNPVPGRLEPVALDGGPLVLVDYAHTPDGLDSAIAAVRALTGGKIHVVFGCGGDRDRGKRPEMARAAVAAADRAYLTLDNPRTEDPEQIFRDAEAGFAGAEGRSMRIDDRREAIVAALDGAGPDDVVLIAGKGHENYQILGTEKQPWDDRAVAREAWSARGGCR